MPLTHKQAARLVTNGTMAKPGVARGPEDCPARCAFIDEKLAALGRKPYAVDSPALSRPQIFYAASPEDAANLIAGSVGAVEDTRPSVAQKDED